LEALAVVWCVKKFLSYILGHKTFVFTDHQALVPLFTSKNIEQAQLIRWLGVLMEYDLTFVYRPGATQVHVDALSRAYVESPVEVEDSSEVQTSEPEPAVEETLVLHVLESANPEEDISSG
jgi:hypothetical protein